MKISVVQTRPVKGDIERNISNHIKLIDLAVSHGAEMVIFPELSLTGYEPELANELAIDKEDNRLNDFQKISDTKLVTIGIGIPTKSNIGTCISMVLFQTSKPRETYSKKYLHADEEAFFVRGESSVGLIGNNNNIAIAICYELSVPLHSENAFKCGAEIYIASAVKSVTAIDNAMQTLSDIAKKYSMTVLLSNCIGQSGGYACAGKTSVWNNKGSLLGQLNDTNEGIIIIDTGSQEIIQRII